MRKLFIPLLVLAVVLAGAWAISMVPKRPEVTMPAYADAAIKFGFIEAFSTVNEGKLDTILFDEAQMINDVEEAAAAAKEDGYESWPEPFYIRNDEAEKALVSLILADDVEITLFENVGDGTTGKRYSIEEARARFATESVLQHLPVWVAFNDHGLVESITQQYLP